MNVPGPRTNPTVQQPLKSRKSLRNWELRLGLAQVVVLIGVITGSMVLAFYLGLNSGQSLGFETALARAAATIPRLPVPGLGAEGAQPQDDGAFDVYAKLNDPLPGAKSETDPIKVEPVKEAEAPLAHDSIFPSEAGGANPSSGMPELGSIKNVDSAPLIDPAAEAALTAKAAAKESTLAEVAGELGKESGGVKEAAGEGELPALPIEAAKVVETEKSTEAAIVEPKSPKKAAVQADPPKPAVVEPKPAAKSPFLKKSLPKGWFAQVVALNSLDEADAMARKLKNSGFGVSIESARVNGVDYFRIVVGPEKSREQAFILVDQLKRESYITSPPFLKVIK